MKKDRGIDIIKVICILLAIGGVSTFFIVYKNFDNKFTFRFVATYMIFLCVSVLYMMVMSLLQLRKFKWVEVKKKLIKFIIIGITFSTLTYSADYIFRPERIDLMRNISTAFGLAFGITFFDLIFLGQRTL